MERRTELVIELLGKGYTQREVATIAEISDSAVSQIAKEYEDKINDLRMESTIAARALDHKLDEMEFAILDSIEKKMAFEPNLTVLTRLYQAINGAKRRTKGEAAPSSVVNNNVVVMQLPTRMREKVVYQSNQQNEIVQVSGRNLATASQKEVNEALAQRNAARIAAPTTDEESEDDSTRTLQASDF